MRLGGVTAEESVDNTETGRGAELFDLSVFWIAHEKEMT